jgi:anti-anti-sigma factor
MTQIAQATSPLITFGSGVVIFIGDLDVATAPALHAQLGRTAAGDPAPHLLVDLSGVTFMDCAGLRPLLAARNRTGAAVSLRNPAPPVLRLLRLLGLTATFTVVGDAPQVTIVPPPPAAVRDRPPRPRRWRRWARIPVPATPERPPLVPHP